MIRPSHFLRLHDSSLRRNRSERNCGIGCAILAVAGMGDELVSGNQLAGTCAMVGALGLALAAGHYEKRQNRTQKQLATMQAAAMSEVLVAFQAPCAPEPEILDSRLRGSESPIEDLE